MNLWRRTPLLVPNSDFLCGRDYLCKALEAVRGDNPSFLIITVQSTILYEELIRSTCDLLIRSLKKYVLGCLPMSRNRLI
jgi:hypothetical protein